MKIEVKNLCKKYENHIVLDNISFQIEENTCNCFVGISGCGKSTLLNILSGWEDKDGGEIYIEGNLVENLQGIFAYMPQEDMLLEWMNILDNVCIYGKIQGNYKHLKEKALQYSCDFGLEGYEYEYPNALSGGMRQRASFLRAILCGKKTLLLDEPFSALDILNKERMQDWLRKIQKKYRLTILFVTHDIDEAIYLSDKIYIMDKNMHNLQECIEIDASTRDREWLFSQVEKKKDIYNKIKGQE